MERLGTGSPILDSALAGGFPEGSAFLVSGDDGAGATEFALTLLRRAALDHKPSKVRFASALRSAHRAGHEYEALFEGSASLPSVDFQVLDAPWALDHAEELLAGFGAHDVLVLESADAIAESAGRDRLAHFWRGVADEADRVGATVFLLHVPGTLPHALEVALAEEADGVLRFAWHDSGPSRRRTLVISKIRGLAPMLDGDQVPVFEVALQRGLGFTISRGKSVL